MNETLFKEIIGNEVDKLQKIIAMGCTETSDFIKQIGLLATLFNFLSQALEG